MKFSTFSVENPLKMKLKNGQLVIGTWINHLRDPIMAKMVATAGFDFVSLDMEHSSASMETIANQCLVARECGIAPLVRPYDPMNAHQNARIMYTGAVGLIVPNVTSKEMAQHVVSSIKYFNGGTRGYSNLSLSSGFTKTFEKDMRRSDEQTVIVIQIESVIAVEKIDEILSVSGVDVVIVGRGDLSHNMGLSGQPNNPLVNDMVNRVFEAAQRHNVTYGLVVKDSESGVSLVKKGARFINFSNEQAILINAYKKFVNELRAT